ncbi:MAG: CPBP family intramembrane metalloprotease [Bdellovibrionales bacterium]|nr:CPBP family intramembrane metalloprotease [Bdellovibrionales bacterium]
MNDPTWVAFIALSLASGWCFQYLLTQEMHGSDAPSRKAFVFSFLSVFFPALFAVCLASEDQRLSLAVQLRLSISQSVYFLYALSFPICVIALGHFGRGILRNQPLRPLLPSLGLLKQMIPLMMVFFVWGFLEEIGWRGFLAQGLLVKLGPVITAIITGVLWSLWHLPQMLFSQQLRASMKEYRVSGTILWGVQCALYGVMLAWLQFHSGSFIVPTLAHALINIVANISEAGLGSSKNPLWDGPSGALAVGGALLLCLTLFF